MTAPIRQIPPRAVSNSEKSTCQTRFRWRGGLGAPASAAAPTICGLPGTRSAAAVPAGGGPLNGGGGRLVASARIIAAILRCPRRADPPRTSRRLPRSRPLSAPAMAPSAGRRRGGGLVLRSSKAVHELAAEFAGRRGGRPHTTAERAG